jgi:SAP domain-containing ribonucleoprotein
MAEYSSLKVPELKKLLAEKGLSQTGNKADLIARLVEDDKKNAPAAEEEKAAESKQGKSHSNDTTALHCACHGTRHDSLQAWLTSLARDR